MTRVILAVHGYADEASLVARAADHGLQVVRRCVDAADLLACATADSEAVIVLTSSLPRLTASTVDQMRRHGRTVIALEIDDGGNAARNLGIDRVVLAHGDGDSVAKALAAALMRDMPDPRLSPELLHPSRREPPVRSRGRLIAVWGPHGAPGRTSVAIGMADALAARGIRVCVVDADTSAPSMAFALGIREQAPGLLGACRRAENGALESQALGACCRSLRGLTVLPGLENVDRWRELRPGLLDDVWSACRERFDVTVIDIAACIDEPDESPWAMDRHAAARTVLASADHVVAVADAGALGAARLAASWHDMRSLNEHAAATVVRNRVRRGLPSRWPQAIAAMGVHADVVDVALARRELDTCWSAGRLPRESRSARSWRRSMSHLAREVMRD